ncbi:hypothetical protein MHU86_9363 [Fragilaria crotonensis]|nr:hypothetical protein MHU86_9363 [Fragilaria crotonensis]
MEANESTGVPREVARQSTLVVGVDNILQRASERIQNLFHKDDENNKAHSMDANESTGVPREVARQSTLVVGVDNILQRASERIQNLFHKDDENNPIQLRPMIDEQPRFYVSLRTLRRYEIRPWIHARLPSKMPAPKSSRSPRRDPPFVAIAMAWRTMFMLNGDT